jgi:hypothetical protein
MIQTVCERDPEERLHYRYVKIYINRTNSAKLVLVQPRKSIWTLGLDQCQSLPRKQP